MRENRKTTLGDCEMPKGRVVLCYSITGGGWNGKCKSNFHDKIGTWEACDAGDINNPESQVRVSIRAEGWSKKVSCSRNQVESMLGGEMRVISQTFQKAAIEHSERNPHSQVEIIDIKPCEESEN